jgi:hypothetical protein
VTVVLTISIPFTSAGIAEGRRDLDRAAAVLEKNAPSVAFAKHPARRVFRRAAGERSREVLDLIPGSKEAALMPSELATRMAPGPNGARLSKSSARAAIRNVQRAESHLLAEGLIDRRVVLIDWSRYEREGAGRYYMSPDDKRVINKCFAKETS